MSDDAVTRTDAERGAAFSAAVAPQPAGTGELAPGVVTTVTPLVRRIIAPNPTLMTGPGTNTYLVGDPTAGDLVVVDPGPDIPAHLDRIAEVAAGRVRTIVVTHTHQDHSPGAPGLAARTGAPTVGFGPRDGFDPDVTAGDGDVVAAAGARLVAFHTPGHASNHLCWLLEEERVLFSGDHVMDGSTVVIAPPDGDMTAYLDQLRRLRALGLRAIAPGHGRLITDPDARLDEYLAHRLAREQQVAATLASLGRAATVEELVAAIYLGVPEALLPVAKYSVWAHLRKLAADGSAVGVDPDDVAAPWVVA
jgi:glyoxylase-like metal-dependent hydrolase (beta-lactamase superfamily II)